MGQHKHKLAQELDRLRKENQRLKQVNSYLRKVVDNTENAHRILRLENIAAKARETTDKLVEFNRVQDPEAAKQISLDLTNCLVSMRGLVIELDALERGIPDPKITPYDGGPGYLALSLVKNLKEPPVDKDYIVVECPKCGQDVYFTDEAKKLIKESQGKLAGVCTECALKLCQAGKGA